MLPQLHYQMSKDTNNKSNKYLGLSNLGINLKKKAEKLSFFSRFRLAVRAKQASKQASCTFVGTKFVLPPQK